MGWLAQSKAPQVTATPFPQPGPPAPGATWSAPSHSSPASSAAKRTVNPPARRNGNRSPSSPGTSGAVSAMSHATSGG